MDFPEEFFGNMVEEGNMYFFLKDCPIGVPEHIHICIKRKDSYLLFSTCSSQTDTAYRLATLKGWDMNTFPVFVKNDENKFTKEHTYVNCNNVIEINKTEFGKLIKTGKVRSMEGKIGELGLQLIGNGVKLSTEVERRIKNLF